MLAAAALILAATLLFGGNKAPSLFGHSIFLVETDDIPPLERGSALITLKVPADELEVRNIIIFNDEDGKTEIGEILSVESGIISVKSKSGAAVVVKAEDIIGKGEYYSEAIGSIVSFATSPAGVCTIALLPLAAFIIFELVSGAKRKDEQEASDTDIEAERERKAAEKEKKREEKAKKAEEKARKRAEEKEKVEEKKLEEKKAESIKKASEEPEEAEEETAPTEEQTEAAEVREEETPEAAVQKPLDKQKLYEAAGLFTPLIKKNKNEAAEEKKKPAAAEKSDEEEYVRKYEPKTEPIPVKEEVRTYQPKQPEETRASGADRLDSIFSRDDEQETDSFDVDEILRSIEENRKNK